jgi:hypothetical protein
MLLSHFFLSFIAMASLTFEGKAQDVRWQWVCSLRGSYGVEVTDDGRADLTGNPMSGNNKTLIEISKKESDAGYRFNLSAYLGNTLTPQISQQSSQSVEVTTQGGDVPDAIAAAVTDYLGGSVLSVVIEKAPKNWRYVEVDSNIMAETVAKQTGGLPGPLVLIRSGECIQTPSQ